MCMLESIDIWFERQFEREEDYKRGYLLTQMLHSKLTKEKKSHKVLILLILLESYFDVTTEWEWGEALKPL